jgi:hypothetical protein
VAASGGAEGNATNSAELRISRIASVMEVSTVVGTIDVNVAAPSTWQVYDIAIETTNGTPTNVKMVMKRTANGYAVSGVGNVAVGSVVVFSIPVNDTFTVFARTNRDNVLMKARATSTDVYLTCRAVTSEYYGIHQTAINFTQLRKEYVKKN